MVNIHGCLVVNCSFMAVLYLEEYDSYDKEMCENCRKIETQLLVYGLEKQW